MVSRYHGGMEDSHKRIRLIHYFCVLWIHSHGSHFVHRLRLIPFHALLWWGILWRVAGRAWAGAREDMHCPNIAPNITLHIWALHCVEIAKALTEIVESLELGGGGGRVTPSEFGDKYK